MSCPCPPTDWLFREMCCLVTWSQVLAHVMNSPPPLSPGRITCKQAAASSVLCSYSGTSLVLQPFQYITCLKCLSFTGGEASYQWTCQILQSLQLMGGVQFRYGWCCWLSHLNICIAQICNWISILQFPLHHSVLHRLFCWQFTVKPLKERFVPGLQKDQEASPPP